MGRFKRMHHGGGASQPDRLTPITSREPQGINKQ